MSVILLSSRRALLPLLAAIGSCVFALAAHAAGDATFYVATCDTPEPLKQRAQFVGDCIADQVEINAALRQLPQIGGVVHLFAGTYDIQRGDTRFGGIFIQRSNTTLRGDGAATKLIQAADQFTNVVRIHGKKLRNVVIRDLYIDANRSQNDFCFGDPWSPGDSFECSGINAWHVTADERRSGYVDNPDDYISSITVENTWVREAYRLNVMLFGRDMIVRNNRLGNAGSDIVEILIGPGSITGNSVLIDGPTGAGLTSDDANGITISDNSVSVVKGGRVSGGVFRPWPGRYRTIISRNRVHINHGAEVNYVVDGKGYDLIVSDNIFTSDGPRMKLYLSSGSLLTGNILTSVDLQFNEARSWPILVQGNFLRETALPAAGRLLTVEGNVVAGRGE